MYYSDNFLWILYMFFYFAKDTLFIFNVIELDILKKRKATHSGKVKWEKGSSMIPVSAGLRCKATTTNQNTVTCLFLRVENINESLLDHWSQKITADSWPERLLLWGESVIYHIWWSLSFFFLCKQRII